MQASQLVAVLLLVGMICPMPLAAADVADVAEAAAAIAAAAAGHDQQHRRLHSDSVPGQAFHNWRDALIRKNFSSSNTGLQQQHEQSPWINIVGLRDRISKLPGPAAINTTHPAAVNRLTAAKTKLFNAATAAAGGGGVGGAAAKIQDSGYGYEYDSAAASAASVERSSTAAAAAAPDEYYDTIAADFPTSMSSSSSSSHHDPPTLAAEAAAQTKSSYATAEDLELTLTSYVRRHPDKRFKLTVNNKPHVIVGFDVPNALQMAVQPAQRPQLLYLLDRARQFGFNTIRLWAFSDGSADVGSAVRSVLARDWKEREKLQHDEELDEVVLQPAPGVLNATVMSDGIDWLVESAGLRALRLILVLTNGGSNAGGGMQQYTHWVDPALTVVDFYGNDTVKSVFLDYMAGLLSHESRRSGLPLREDPVIAGWQLAHQPRHPGHPASDALTAWLRQMGVFMKEHAPHQLFLTGLEGYFGPHSPHHLQHNPHAQVFESASVTPHTYNAVCHGTDFWYHSQPAEVDVATADVTTDQWMACNRSCKLSWTREWIKAHLRDALRLQKPLLLTGVGVLRPHSWRQEFLQVIHDEMQLAVAAGQPLGGVILSGLLHPDQPDVTGYGIHDSVTGVTRQRPPLADVTQRAVSDVKWHRFMQHSEYLSCLQMESRGAVDLDDLLQDTKGWVKGWEGVVQAEADIAGLGSSSSSSGSGSGSGTGSGRSSGGRGKQPTT